MGQRGFSFIDVLVGIALLVIIFSGIFGAYQLGLKVLNQSQHRVVATALANEFLEIARNLPYGQVGVDGGFPTGFFSASQEVLRNGANYTVEVDIDYVADAADGLVAPEDICLNDYKRMLVTASWQGRFPGQVHEAGDIAPSNEVQECGDTGGLLRVNVFDAAGIAVSNANVEVEDVNTALSDVCATALEGTCQMLLPASLPGQGENYKIRVSKPGHSREETFTAGDFHQGQIIATPEHPHATLLEGEITETSFSIDALSSFTIETRSSRGREEFTDSFDDTSLLSDLQYTEVVEGELRLSAPQEDPSGTATSETITHVSLLSWGEVSFSKVLPPQTTLTVQILYYDGLSWVLVPEEDLPGNTAGFISSPADLFSLNVILYPQLRLQGNLGTTDPSATPSLSQWSISYFTMIDFALVNIPFLLEGAKLVGETAAEQPIFKYSQDLATGGSGQLSLGTMEWDSYIFSVDQEATDFSVAETVPAPQPISLSPNIAQQVTLYLAAENSLLVTVQELGTAAPIFSASAGLTRIGFDQTQLTNEVGQTLFIPLDAETYTIEVTSEGYEDFSDTILVSGNTTTTIELELNPD